MTGKLGQAQKMLNKLNVLKRMSRMFKGLFK